MVTQTFQRNELKYMVNEKEFLEILKRINGEMEYDPFCTNGESYMIYNLYFDNERDDIIKHSLSKPYYKEKLRLRSYKMPTKDDDTVFLELKKKVGSVVAKRRAILHYDEALLLGEKGIIPHTESFKDFQVSREIAEFSRQNKVFPKLYLSYERVAFFHKVDLDFRISFDRNLLTRRSDVTLKNGNYGTKLIDDGTYIMEIKCKGAIPLWFTDVLSDLKLYKTSFSKYGTEFKQYINSKEKVVC